MTQQDARKLQVGDRIYDVDRPRVPYRVVRAPDSVGVIDIRRPHAKTEYVLPSMLKRFQRHPQSTRKGRKRG